MSVASVTGAAQSAPNELVFQFVGPQTRQADTAAAIGQRVDDLGIFRVIAHRGADQPHPLRYSCGIAFKTTSLGMMRMPPLAERRITQ